MYKPIIYFAGKIKVEGVYGDHYYDWRNSITGFMKHQNNSMGDKKSELVQTELADYVYGGPNYYHEHGYVYEGYIDHKETYETNIQLISDSDILFVYFDSDDSYGTIAEIGYARALGKKIFICYTDKLDKNDMWFVLSFADIAQKVKNHKDGREYFNTRFLYQRTEYIKAEIGYDDLRNMDYKDFLKTSYRKKISKRAKNIAGNKCNICNSTNRLETHHKSYERRGHEGEINDLVCLCHNCHSKFHNKVGTNIINADIEFDF